MNSLQAAARRDGPRMKNHEGAGRGVEVRRDEPRVSVSELPEQSAQRGRTRDDPDLVVGECACAASAIPERASRSATSPAMRIVDDYTRSTSFTMGEKAGVSARCGERRMISACLNEVLFGRPDSSKTPEPGF
ncbi:hypothetical protein Aduo_016940 [Ancylostoma duodenale]